jgi:hypothetical protein
VSMCLVNGRDQKEETRMVWSCKKNGIVQTAKNSPRNENNCKRPMARPQMR